MFCRVIKKHESGFSDPLILKKGEKVKIEDKKTEWLGWIWCISNEGKKGWIPEIYLNLSGKTAVLLDDYNATELTVQVGQIFQIKKEVSGWIWISSDNGNSGWIPKENVELILD